MNSTLLKSKAQQPFYNGTYHKFITSKDPVIDILLSYYNLEDKLNVPH